MTADALIELLAERRLVEPSVLSALRRQITESSRPVKPSSILRKLVEKRHLTQPQARDLLETLEARAGAVGDEFAMLDDDADVAATQPIAKPPTRLDKDWGKKAAKSSDRGLQELSEVSAPLEDLLANFANTAGPPELNYTAPAYSVQAPRTIKRKPGLWDNPWVLLGGGAVVTLLLLGPVLAWAIRREDADQTLERAVKELQSRAFPSAMEAFDLFLKRFPEHRSASQARVLRGMADIQQYTSAASAWAKALERQQELLPVLAKEPAFTENRQGLADLLVDTRIGLAEMALASAEEAHGSKNDPATLEKSLTRAKALLKSSEESLEFLRVYTIAASHPLDKLSKGDEIAAITQGKIDELDALSALLVQIDDWIGKEDVSKALEASDELIRRYAVFNGDERLVSRFNAAAKTLAGKVHASNETKAAEKPSQLPRGAAKKIFPTEITGDPYPALDKKIAVVQAGGSVFGIRADTGAIVWRHPAHSDWIRPLTSEKLCWFVGDDRRSLFTAELVSGKLLAKQTFDSDLVAFEQDGDVIAAVEHRGAIHILSSSLQLSRTIQLPLPISKGVAIDFAKESACLLAESGYAFRVLLSDGKCTGCLFVGHAPLSASTTGIVADGVFIAPFSSTRGGVIAAFGDDENGEWRLKQQVDIPSPVLTPLAVARNRLAASQANGAFTVYEVRQNRGEPLAELAKLLSTQNDTSGARYSALMGDCFCSASQGIVGYRVQTTTQRIDPVWRALDEQTVLSPPLSMGKAAVIVHQTKAKAEIRATLVDVNDNGRVYWSALLSAPAASDGSLLQDGAAVIRLLNGQVWNIAQNSDLRNTGIEVANTSALFGDRIASMTPSGELHVYKRRQNDWEALRNGTVIKQAAEFSPIPFGDGFLAADGAGRIEWLSEMGERLAMPFQPPMRLGEKAQWTKPAVLGTNRFAVSFGQRLFAVSVTKSDEGWAKLSADHTYSLNSSLAGPLASTDERLYSLDIDHGLQSWKAADLSDPTRLELPHEIHWGPIAIGKALLVCAAGKLYAIQGGETIWTAVCEDEIYPPTPVTADNILVATPSGKLTHLSLANGVIERTEQLGFSLARSPFPIGAQYWAPSYDGAWYHIEPSFIADSTSRKEVQASNTSSGVLRSADNHSDGARRELHAR